jgi:hypothetical protein
MSALTWWISAESVVLPGQHHTRTGIPERVTATPITIWGRSSAAFADAGVRVVTDRAGVDQDH